MKAKLIRTVAVVVVTLIFLPFEWLTQFGTVLAALMFIERIWKDKE